MGQFPQIVRPLFHFSSSVAQLIAMARWPGSLPSPETSRLSPLHPSSSLRSLLPSFQVCPVSVPVTSNLTFFDSRRLSRLRLDPTPISLHPHFRLSNLAYWCERPELFSAIADATTDEERSVAVLRWFIVRNVSLTFLPFSSCSSLLLSVLFRFLSSFLGSPFRRSCPPSSRTINTLRPASRTPAQLSSSAECWDLKPENRGIFASHRNIPSPTIHIRTTHAWSINNYNRPVYLAHSSIRFYDFVEHSYRVFAIPGIGNGQFELKLSICSFFLGCSINGLLGRSETWTTQRFEFTCQDHLF